MILNAGGSALGDNSSFVMLWENPDTTVPFNAGSITVDCSEYLMVCILLKDSIDGSIVTSNLVQNIVSASNKIHVVGEHSVAERSVSISRNGTINITEGTYNKYNSNGTVSITTDNAKAIPYRIYGMRVR